MADTAKGASLVVRVGSAALTVGAVAVPILLGVGVEWTLVALLGLVVVFLLAVCVRLAGAPERVVRATGLDALIDEGTRLRDETLEVGGAQVGDDGHPHPVVAWNQRVDDWFGRVDRFLTRHLDVPVADRFAAAVAPKDDIITGRRGVHPHHARLLVLVDRGLDVLAAVRREWGV